MAKTIPYALKFVTAPGQPAGDPESLKSEVSLWIEAGNHSNIVPVHDGFLDNHLLVIVSDYVEGGTLRDWLLANKKKAPTPEKAVEMIRGILQGVSHLHKRNISHRDLKPENILLKNGNPQITDFGVSRLVETLSRGAQLVFTQGAGSPYYMPPEAFGPSIPTLRLDTWSAGVIFYEMLSGTFPFNGRNMNELFGEITSIQPQPLAPDLTGLQAFVSKSLAKDPAQRFQTAAEMAEALEYAWADTRREWERGLRTRPDLGRAVGEPREDNDQSGVRAKALALIGIGVLVLAVIGGSLFWLSTKRQSATSPGNALEAKDASSNGSPAKDEKPLAKNPPGPSVAPQTNTQGHDLTSAKPRQSPNQIPEQKQPATSDSRARADQEGLGKPKEAEEQFFNFLSNARQEPNLGHSGAACRDYQRAAAIVPQRFRNRVRFELVKDATVQYQKGKDHYPEALALFEKAFQAVPEP